MLTELGTHVPNRVAANRPIHTERDQQQFLSPHPGPLPGGEGESHPVSFMGVASTLFGRGLTGSLSLGERAGVRGRRAPKFPNVLFNPPGHAH